MTKYAYRLETKRIREKDFPYNNQELCSAEQVFEFCRTLQDLDIEKLITFTAVPTLIFDSAITH